MGFKGVTGLGSEGGLRRLFSSWFPTKTCELGVTIFFFVRILSVCFVGVIKAEFTKEMDMFVTHPTTEGNMIVVQGLEPFFILVV